MNQQSYDDKREDQESECLMKLGEEKIHEQLAEWNANHEPAERKGQQHEESCPPT
jgi:hypothetical protein